MKSDWQLKFSVAALTPTPPVLPDNCYHGGRGKERWRLPTDGQLTEWTLPEAPSPSSCALALGKSVSTGGGERSSQREGGGRADTPEGWLFGRS